jgi:hypothetical protein
MPPSGTLHITNGDSVLYLFRKAGLTGTHIAWRDALQEGPVPYGDLEDVSRVRADYASARGYGHPIAIHREFEQRDAAFRKAGEYDEIVLWFEHDLYDQLQLMQILSAMASPAFDSSRVSLVQSDQYLGMLDAQELMALYPKRRTLSDGASANAVDAWGALTAEAPDELARLASAERVGLPHVRAAFARLLEEFPAIGDGLSRSQRQAMIAIVRAPATREDVFRRAEAQEEAPFMGESQFYAMLEDLASATNALLVRDGEKYAPTALGKRIVDGEANWMREAQPERWIGGTHLTPSTPWRYDHATKRLHA